MPESFSLYVHTSFNVYKVYKGEGCFSLRQEKSMSAQNYIHLYNEAA